MLDKTMEAIRKFTLNISVAAILIMAVMEILEIFARSFFNFSFLVVDEFAGYLMSCMVFMGLANSYHAGSFVRVEALYSRFKGRFKRILDGVYTFILIIFTAVFGYYSILLNYKSFDRGLVSTGYYMTRLAIPQFFMSLGIILFFIYLILDFVKMIKTKGGEK